MRAGCAHLSRALLRLLGRACQLRLQLRDLLLELPQLLARLARVRGAPLGLLLQLGHGGVLGRQLLLQLLQLRLQSSHGASCRLSCLQLLSELVVVLLLLRNLHTGNDVTAGPKKGSGVVSPCCEAVRVVSAECKQSSLESPTLTLDGLLSQFS